jgi:hypothetical protein
LYLALAGVHRFAADDQLISQMEMLAADASLGDDDRIELHFALGKAFDDIGDVERAFEHLRRGNSLKRSHILYDEGASFAEIERIRDVFSAKLLRQCAGSGDPSQRPVFVVGMLRSGTTLIDQILASHPHVFGVGESSAMHRQATMLAGPYPDALPDLDPSVWARLGAGYLQEVGARAPDVLRIVDKMPSNFLLVGLIHLALPNARIVHAVRDPLDTCLSCFSTLFRAGQPHTHDLAELGRYWRHYRTLMDHWHAVLPSGVMIDVGYEDLVTDLEGQIRRLLAHCGLEWHQRCLEFYHTDRVVRTASFAQVRQPLYGRSVGRWRAYGEQRLQPLIQALHS